MAGPISKSEQRWVVVVAVAVVVASCLPYLAAWLLTPDDTQYTGLLINHNDGHSYYAKMQQGARGDWLFRLAFTPEPHAGAFIYTFYLALGQIAGALHLPIPLVYHAARVIAGLFMLLVAYRLAARCLEQVSSRRVAFLLVALGSGLGWVAAPLGPITADVWVAEGFAFLSILTNPHFPLAIGLMLILFITALDSVRERPGRWRAAGVVAVAALLAIVQPFAVPVVLAVLGVYVLLHIYRKRRLPWRSWNIGGPLLHAVLVGVGAAPVMAYDLYVFTANPAMAAWGAQNVTPSLPPWSYVLGFGLLLLLAIPGSVIALRRGEPAGLLLVTWVVTAIVLLYVPFALQRRFIFGLQIPLALLAGLAVNSYVLSRLPRRRRGLVTVMLLVVCALTNIMVPLLPVLSVAQGQQPLVVPASQAAALEWLGAHTRWTDTVLAPPDVSHLVPAWAGNRVVYGHPFETIDADEKKAEAERFFDPGTASGTRAAILERYGVRYVLSVDPAFFSTPPQGLELAWREEGVSIYRVGAAP